MGGDGSAALGFIGGHGNGLQMRKHLLADAVGNILGDGDELPGLPHAGCQRQKTQQQGYDQCYQDKQHWAMPLLGKEWFDGVHDHTGLIQQNLIHQKGHQQRNGNRSQCAQQRYHVRNYQFAFMRERNIANPRPLNSRG